MLAAAFSDSTTVVAHPPANTSSGATPWPAAAGRCTEADTFALAHASLESMSLDAMRAVLRGLIASSADAANELEYSVALWVAQAVAQSADPVEQHRPQHEEVEKVQKGDDGENQGDGGGCGRGQREVEEWQRHETVVQKRDEEEHEDGGGAGGCQEEEKLEEEQLRNDARLQQMLGDYCPDARTGARFGNLKAFEDLWPALH